MASAEREPVPFETSERGFKHYEPIRSTYGDLVRVYESSAADAPHLWVSLDPAPKTVGNPAAHLDAEAVEWLIATLQTALDNHYQRPAPASPEPGGGGDAVRLALIAALVTSDREDLLTGDAIDDDRLWRLGFLTGLDERRPRLTEAGRAFVSAAAAGSNGCGYLEADGSPCTGDLVESLVHLNERMDWTPHGTSVCARHLAEHRAADPAAPSVPAGGAGEDVVVQLRVRRANLRHLTSEDGTPVNGAIALRQAADGVYELEALTDLLTGLAAAASGVEQVDAELVPAQLPAPAGGDGLAAFAACMDENVRMRRELVALQRPMDGLAELLTSGPAVEVARGYLDLANAEDLLADLAARLSSTPEGGADAG